MRPVAIVKKYISGKRKENGVEAEEGKEKQKRVDEDEKKRGKRG